MDHVFIELAARSSEQAPRAFLEAVVPYMLRVMELTGAQPVGHPLADRHFSMRIPSTGLPTTLTTRCRGGVAALRKLAATSPEAARPILEILAADPHDGAHRLLYEGLRAADSTTRTGPPPGWPRAATGSSADTRKTPSGRPGCSLRP